MYVVVLVTTSTKKEAEKIAQVLLKKRLAACVNIIPSIHSHFWWKGQIERSNEVLMVIKSKNEMFDQLVESVKSTHSYQVPEILALPVQQGSNEYLNWIDTILNRNQKKKCQDSNS